MSETIQYSIVKGKGDEIHSLSWDVEFGLIDKPRELQSYSKESTKPVFQIRIEIHEDNVDEMDMRLYFLYPANAYIKCVITYTDALVDEGHVLIESEFNMIKANVWKNILNFNRNHIDVHEWRLGEYVEFNLLIQFTILNNVDNNNNEKSRSVVNAQGFFITGLFSDAVIKSSDEKEYKVHKVITSSKSEVFKAHFQHSMTKCDTDIVKSPFESDVLEAVLSFIYSDVDSSINGIPEKVLPAADYYQLLELKSLCEKELCKNITIENTIEFLELADLHSAEMLKESVLKFMGDKADLLVKTEAWAELKSERLMKMIFENVKCCKEKEIIFYECKFS